MAEARTAIVTGAASGIGLASARELHRQGWQVVAADLSEEGLAAAETAFEGTAKVRFERLDVTDEAEVVRLIARTDREFGPLRGVVNSAGTGRDVPILETGTDLFRRLFEVNVVATFTVGREAAKAMRDRGGGGAIVNIGSVSGLRGNVGRSAYGASKGAIVTLTQVMAVELAEHGIRVNAIAPGPIETALTREIHTEDVRAGWIRTVPMRRYGTPEEIAATVAFLLDDRTAAYVTGQTISVDGGFTAGGLMR